MAIAEVDSYSESNYTDTSYAVYAGNIISFGQSFHCAEANTLSNCKFYLKKLGSPTGNVVAKLYACTGTFGETSVPTGDALAVSDAFDITNLTTSHQLITFTFSDENQVALEEDTNYVIQCEYTGGDVNNCLLVGYDAVLSDHEGNISRYNGSAWFYSATGDCVFYVNGDFGGEVDNTIANGSFFLVL